MTDEATQPRSGFSWLAGRSSRREYWVNVGILLAISFALNKPPVLGLVLTSLLFIAQVRRIHDLGRTGWWAVAANLVPLASLTLWPVASEEHVLLVGVAIELVIIVAIGAIQGNATENRFGPPPPFTLRRLLTGR